MNKFRRGFTLIEVALFLAVTGALFVGVTVGVQNSIFQQRYNDSVQNFAEFLRSVYSEVSNVQSIGDGRSETAIYGKLVTFGESTDLEGCPVNRSEVVPSGTNCEGKDATRNAVFVYDVVGKVGETESGNIIKSLKELHANVVMVENGTITPIGIVEDYSPKWAAQIEGVGDSYTVYKGALLIVRHPKSGTTYTYSTGNSGTLEINQEIAKIRKDISSLAEGVDGKMSEIDNLLIGKLDKFGQTTATNFCINPNSGERYALRRDVRLAANARNASGVEVIATDSKAEGNECSAY